MKISIIIVSFNVKHLLEQCLYSVEKALRFTNQSARETTLATVYNSEIFVVDNHSSDGSMQYLPPLFPSVSFIANTHNNGFASANNQALTQASGDYILFLNPDTLIPEDFFTRMIAFMEATPTAGACGPQMINGKGIFLKESKRGLPGVWASFCKMVGLTALFPASKIFARYYLGHLNKDENQEAEVLSGACLFVSQKAISKTGGFDERFFMYAEDVDLSYRILESGFKNHYISDTAIIHFKGESTVKDFRYVRLFYKAMVQFVEKHYTGVTGKVYAFFLKVAIGLRALFAFGELQLRNKNRSGPGDNRSIAFWGDDKAISLLKLPEHESVLTNDPAAANEIYLCEGPRCSFREIIELMKKNPGRNYRIVASNVAGGNEDS